MPDQAQSRTSVLITAEELEARLESSSVVLLDIRFSQDKAYDPRTAYLAGHLPGAVAVDFVHELTGRPEGFSGKRPLPPIERLQHDARRWGIRSDSLVVLYDDNRNRQAARGWWTLRWAGLDQARLLDGGLHAWTARGHALETAVPLSARGDVVLSSGRLPHFSADDAAGFVRNGVLIDARDAAFFAAGHIPGAINIPTSGNIDPENGAYASADTLKARFAALGVDGSKPVGVYCGGGVAASHQIAALAAIGIEASLFPGSWSAWSADPARPRETGVGANGQ
ncbi:rhodanese-like domain-containing protein [Mesorhizobium sp. RP14(2022)]|uniref:Rhodanese-like domain-containing protein n=1 Tax=Mesorhizobium liriopis TaxID=2953882 RepID=A0ABT1C6B7_9HYPH|nr:rhodanese-like domain-containing protein [Mesorhizobium liriopis]MCO6050369.1 rhodanese-like domain-containing protein [Mesorhizobium liriopis]